MKLLERLTAEFTSVNDAFGEVVLTVKKSEILPSCNLLKNKFGFDTLIDLCGVDYRSYTKGNWQPTTDNFLRAKEDKKDFISDKFAVVYHLLSIKHNYRLRVKTYLTEDDLIIDSVIDIWNVANWYEREAFDMFGILFNNHPDLRRILTDYGFIGHPLRKDFPTVGEVEMRYDEKLGRVAYEPVTINMRNNVPRVVRE